MMTGNYEFVGLSLDQMRTAQSWNVPSDVLHYYEHKMSMDSQMFCYYQSYYFSHDVIGREYMWPALIENDDHFKFVQYYMDNIATNNNCLADHYDSGTVNYINRISEGCTKLVTPSENPYYVQINFMILQLADWYYHNYGWKSPIIATAIVPERQPTTPAPGPRSRL